jgi:hypothetical protein
VLGSHAVQLSGGGVVYSFDVWTEEEREEVARLAAHVLEWAESRGHTVRASGACPACCSGEACCSQVDAGFKWISGLTLLRATVDDPLLARWLYLTLRVPFGPDSLIWGAGLRARDFSVIISKDNSEAWHVDRGQNYKVRACGHQRHADAMLQAF